MFNNISASGNGVPRKRGEDAASLSGAPKLDSRNGKRMDEKRKEAIERYKKAFARRLRIACAAADMTGHDLRKACEIPSSRCVYDYLNAKSLPNAFNIARICKALNIDANELLGIRRPK